MDFQVKGFNHTQAREEGWDLVTPIVRDTGYMIWQHRRDFTHAPGEFIQLTREARTFVLSRAVAGYSYHIKALGLCAVSGVHLPAAYGEEYPFAMSFLKALQIHAKAGGSPETFADAVLAGSVR